MASISQSTPLGRSFTATQLRAGLEVKYLAYTSLKAAKSAMSARKQVVLTLVKAHAGSFEDSAHIAAALVSLCGDALGDCAGGGVYRDLAGGEDETAHGVALRVGADGAGSFFGADDVHIDYLTYHK